MYLHWTRLKTARVISQWVRIASWENRFTTAFGESARLLVFKTLTCAYYTQEYTSSGCCFLHMRRKVLMEVAHLLGLPDDLRIDQFTITASALMIEVISTQPICCCPICGQTSDQIHSCYRRVVADVPCGNRLVSLHLQVRKFFCRNTNCLRKIFTERVPELLEPSARMTNRLRSALQALGLATGAEVSARLAPKLGCRWHPPRSYISCEASHLQ